MPTSVDKQVSFNSVPIIGTNEVDSNTQLASDEEFNLQLHELFRYNCPSLLDDVPALTDQYSSWTRRPAEVEANLPYTENHSNGNLHEAVSASQTVFNNFPLTPAVEAI